jgi:hypothetical protein
MLARIYVITITMKGRSFGKMIETLSQKFSSRHLYEPQANDWKVQVGHEVSIELFSSPTLVIHC